MFHVIGTLQSFLDDNDSHTVHEPHENVHLDKHINTIFYYNILPWKGPPRFLTEGHMSMTKWGLACV